MTRAGVVAATAMILPAGAALAGQGGGNFSPLDDPEGDVIDLGFGGPLLDLDTISVSYSDTALFFDIAFYTPIAPTSEMVPESIFGWLEFDVDQNPMTGFEPFQNFYKGFETVEFGTDFALNFNDLNNPGQMELIDTDAGPVGLIDVAFTEFSFSGSIPLSLMSLDEGVVDFVTIAGTPLQPTDATNLVGTSSPIPAPAAMALLAMAGLAGGRRR